MTRLTEDQIIGLIEDQTITPDMTRQAAEFYVGRVLRPALPAPGTDTPDNAVTETPGPSADSVQDTESAPPLPSEAPNVAPDAPTPTPAPRLPSDLWSRACGRLCQVSRGAGKARAVGVVIDVAGDRR